MCTVSLIHFLLLFFYSAEVYATLTFFADLRDACKPEGWVLVDGHHGKDFDGVLLSEEEKPSYANRKNVSK